MSVTHIERETSPDGTVRIIDNRRLQDVIAWQLAMIKQCASDRILAFAPEHSQRNAALGLLSDRDTLAIRNFISATRTRCDELETEIAAVHWDGQRATHAAACDAVQAVTW